MADLASKTWIQPAALYGGTSRKDQASMLSRGYDVLVTTPRRRIDMLQWSYIDGAKILSLRHLSHVEINELYLTEALGTVGVFSPYEKWRHDLEMSVQLLKKAAKPPLI